MKRIPLYNRYNDNLYLENIKDNNWVLKAKDPDDLSYMRIGFTDASHEVIDFIDPSGGPFMEVGNSIEGKEITGITHKVGTGFILTLKDEDNKN